jgi:hypothetical protein
MNLLQKATYFILFFSLFFFGNKLLGQTKTLPNSFIIHGTMSAEKKLFYAKSIEASDMESLRLKTEKVVLKFKNGFLLELLPAKELVIKNIASTIDINKYSDYSSQINHKNPVFEVLDSGWITAEIQNSSKDK